MAYRRQELEQLVNEDNNNNLCADCRDQNPSWASCTLGVFLCQQCAGVHRGLSSPQSRIKSIKLDNWDKEQVQMLQMVGNAKANNKYEQCVPVYYRRPSCRTIDVLRKEWIMAKYERMEFMDPDNQTAYSCVTKTGLLWKLGKDKKQFNQRKFVLSRVDNRFYYYDLTDDNGKKPQQPRAEADLDYLNAVFVPDKIGNPYGLQITFFKNGSTRNLFVYSESSKEIVDWYMCIRAAKWERRRIAFPDRDRVQLAEDLTKDFLMEGWLSKMGPKNEPFRRRWFTLDHRKLMYFEEPLNEFAKGEVFLGHRDSGYSVSPGMEDAGDRSATSNHPSNSYCFTLHTPDRNFVLRAETQEEMQMWMAVMEQVVDLPLTLQDSKLSTLLVAKKVNAFRLTKR